jgi:hypothetical protein
VRHWVVGPDRLKGIAPIQHGLNLAKRPIRFAHLDRDQIPAGAKTDLLGEGRGCGREGERLAATHKERKEPQAQRGHGENAAPGATDERDWSGAKERIHGSRGGFARYFFF